ncbi:HoxV [Pseudomonas sp. HS-18]|uniref:HoxV n=1 Tax=Pseudomonas sp. HS-18 TaxID=2879114 RepID=UPI001CF0D4E7|nr:HoxV [Pseudomonas sp. HS-18]UCL89577.1 HoxV [Pseudomonas sp. HS-18]
MSVGEGLSRLAGSLRVRPAQQPALLGGRPPLAGRLLRGQPAEAAVRHLPLIYSLCGQAHRLTAELALQAAIQGGGEPDDQARQRLREENIREHLRHILLDWPRLLAGPQSGVKLLSPRPAQNLDSWFDGSAQDWLQRWHTDPRKALLEWSLHSHHPLARLLHDCRRRAEALVLSAQALPTTPASLLEIGRSLGGEEDFLRRPELCGEPRETGAWTRGRETRPERYDTAWLRLGARLADLVELSQAPAAPLEMGALALGESQALAWSETARGLLLHRVRLEPAPGGWKICDYRILAPTEWNLHPRGTLARALETLPDDAMAARQAELLLAVFDPCLPYRLESPVLTPVNTAGALHDA